MFWSLFFLITSICIPGIFFILASEKKILSSSETENIPLNARVLSHIIIVLLFAVIGSFFSLKVNLIDSFTLGLANWHLDSNALSTLLTTGLLYGVICSLGNIIIYYFYFKKALDTSSFEKIENHYNNMGIGSRIFYGGFVEEIIFRFGIMSFFVWIGTLFFQEENLVVNLFAILISSFLFALAHLPGISSIGLKKSPLIIGYALGGNIWVGIWAGIAFIQSGIFAAILVHILFHLLWFPIQVFSRYNKEDIQC